jgi:hypothetical protein
VNTQLGDLALVFVLGALVGAGELVSRFRDEPTRAIASSPGGLYLAVNGAASAFALAALWTFGWNPAPDSVEQTRLLQILAAGFGAMAVFRSSLFKVRIGATDMGVGPVAFLEIMLSAIDGAVDRKRARERAEHVLTIMNGLKFSDLYAALPAFSFALMQSLSSEDKGSIGNQINQLAASTMRDEAKVLNLGLLLMNYVGEGVLSEAVTALRKQLGLDPPVATPSGLFTLGGGGSQNAAPVGGITPTAGSAAATAPTPSAAEAAAESRMPLGAAPGSVPAAPSIQQDVRPADDKGVDTAGRSG